MSESHIRFSLCIPTMDRFDSFLRESLQNYIQLKQKGIIDEIIVVDENGNDYEKITMEFGDEIAVYKNETVLGVFHNKIRSASYAKSGNFIALIDSDNFVDEQYFKVAKDFIIEKNLTPDMPVVLAPTFAKPNYDYRCYNEYLFNAETVLNLYYQSVLHTFLNTANFIITKCVDEQLVYDNNVITQLHYIDSLYKHVLAFEQIPDYRLYAVSGLEYEHRKHADSYFVKNLDNDELNLNVEFCLNKLREIVASSKK